jgi:hypothetical protein
VCVNIPRHVCAPGHTGPLSSSVLWEAGVGNHDTDENHSVPVHEPRFQSLSGTTTSANFMSTFIRVVELVCSTWQSSSCHVNELIVSICTVVCMFLFYSQDQTSNEDRLDFHLLLKADVLTPLPSDTRLTSSVRPRIEGFCTQLGSTICLGTVASTCIHYPTLQWDHGVSFSHRCSGSACAASSISTLLPFEVVHYTSLVHCLSH